MISIKVIINEMILFNHNLFFGYHNCFFRENYYRILLVYLESILLRGYSDEIGRDINVHLNIFSGNKDPYAPDYFKGLWSRFKSRSKLLEDNQTLYSFRHTGAIDIYKRTGSIEKLKTALGHSNIMVSLTYLRGLDLTELEEGDMPSI